MAAIGADLTFSQLKKGMVARITRVGKDNEDQQRLQEMGLTLGTSFKVVKVAPFGDPVEIDIRGYRLCLRKHETKDFEVEPVVA